MEARKRAGCGKSDYSEFLRDDATGLPAASVTVDFAKRLAAANVLRARPSVARGYEYAALSSFCL